MNIGTLCQRDTVTVSRSDKVIKAVQLMRQRHVGYLVVVEADGGRERQRPVGVLTDRDIIITVVARDLDPASVRVGDIMTQPPVTVSESEPVEKALREMRRVGVRRLPVIGPGSELVGVISLDDLLNVLAGELQSLAGSIRNEQWNEGERRP